MAERKKLGELLLEAKVITATQLQSAIAHQRQWGVRLGTALIEKGFVDEETLAKFLSVQRNVPCVTLGKLQIPPEVLKRIPKEVQEKHLVVPVAVVKEGNRESLVVAMADPTNLQALDELRFAIGAAKIKPVIAVEAAIKRVILGETRAFRPAVAASAPSNLRSERTDEFQIVRGTMDTARGAPAAAPATMPEVTGDGIEAPVGEAVLDLDEPMPLEPEALEAVSAGILLVPPAEAPVAAPLRAPSGDAFLDALRGPPRQPGAIPAGPRGAPTAPLARPPAPAGVLPAAPPSMVPTAPSQSARTTSPPAAPAAPAVARPSTAAPPSPVRPTAGAVPKPPMPAPPGAPASTPVTATPPSPAASARPAPPPGTPFRAPSLPPFEAAEDDRTEPDLAATSSAEPSSTPFEPLAESAPWPPSADGGATADVADTQPGGMPGSMTAAAIMALGASPFEGSVPEISLPGPEAAPPASDPPARGAPVTFERDTAPETEPGPGPGAFAIPDGLEVQEGSVAGAASPAAAMSDADAGLEATAADVAMPGSSREGAVPFAVSETSVSLEPDAAWPPAGAKGTGGASPDLDAAPALVSSSAGTVLAVTGLDAPVDAAEATAIGSGHHEPTWDGPMELSAPPEGSILDESGAAVGPAAPAAPPPPPPPGADIEHDRASVTRESPFPHGAETTLGPPARLSPMHLGGGGTPAPVAEGTPPTKASADVAPPASRPTPTPAPAPRVAVEATDSVVPAPPALSDEQAALNALVTKKLKLLNAITELLLEKGLITEDEIKEKIRKKG